MKTTHDLINGEIERCKENIAEFESQLKAVKNESGQNQECLNCKTKNLHYYPHENTWACAFC